MEDDFKNISNKVNSVLPDDWIGGFELGWSWTEDFERRIYSLYLQGMNSNLLKLLYDAGYDTGKRLGEGILSYFELEPRSLKERAYYFDVFLSKIQIVTIKYSKEEGYRVLTFIGGTQFSRNFKELTGESICHHTAGLIAGCTKALFNRDVIVVESRCLAKGDTDCEFRVWVTD